MKKRLFDFSEEDEKLWVAVKNKVKPLTKRPKKSEDLIFSHVGLLPVKNVFVKHASFNTLEESSNVSVGILEAKDKKDIKSGKIKLEGSLDLHGYTLKEAEIAFENFIISSFSNNLRFVLVITGKGLRNIETATESFSVLQRGFLDWVCHPRFSRYILSYCESFPKDGGSGAFYVRLRKQKNF